MKKNWQRRDILKVGGLLTLGTPLLGKNLITKQDSIPLFNTYDFKPDKPITAVVLGAGNRGNTYSGFSEKFPDNIKIVGVAEPIEVRRKTFAERYKIPEKYQWVTWEHALQIPKFADALIITTPDNLHYGPAMEGLKLNYDLLLEKPIAQSWKECYDILKLAKEKNRIVAVCHVLRYTPYFRKLKEVMDSGELGEIVSIQHFEPVNHIHMSHSYVRGNWRNTKESNPMLLAKSCHDLDMMRWLINLSCKKVSSFGSLKLFKKENAPAGCAMRCTDGCKVEAECPYSALKIYYRDRTYLHHFDLPKEGDEGEAIMKNLKEGPYGRCVYHCDNDVVDHQIVAMEFDKEITCAFSMEAFTSYHGRRSRIMGTMGDAVGDMDILTVNNFRTGKETRYETSKLLKDNSGHGGGDYGLMHDFVKAVAKQDPKMLTSTIDASMESHLIAFKAEESRLTGKVVDVSME